MQNILIILLLFIVHNSFSQEMKSTFNQIVEAEAKSASKTIHYKANINTANYDVTYHRLDFTIDPSVAFINGIVTTDFTAKSDLTTVTFDLTDNMIVTQVIQNGSALSFSQNTNDELVITLSATLFQGQSTSVKITYSGNPISSGFGSFEQSTHYGDPVIWTLSEPYGAKGWWPCKQDLNDKIDNIDVYITSPQFNPSNEEYIAVSNGLEQSQVITGSNKTTHFKHQYAIPAYLIAIAVTNYEVYSHTVDNNGNPFDIVNYVYPENLSSAQSQTGVTVDIMNLFTQLFEEYPFADEKYGHAQFGWGGGMEHTTVSFMGNFSRGLIAHELAHQWFGDKITCGSWKDIWLNEGFATYLSGLTIENLDYEIKNSFKNWRNNLVTNQFTGITTLPDGSVYLSDIDTMNIAKIFSGRLSYNKGAMVLHMLRKKLGDTTFFQGMKDYLADPNLAFGYAKTHDFIVNMEAISGQDLSEFFNDWIYNQGYPSYTLTWHQPQTNQLKITINQTQSHVSVNYFEAPVPIRVHGTGGEILDFVLNNTFEGEEFLETINFQVTQVEVDPDTHLISKNNSAVLSIDDEILSSKFAIYPNPVSTELSIDKPNDIFIENITIFNTLGQIESELQLTEKIKVSKLSSGLYFIKVQTDRGTVHKSFLKK